MATDLHKYTTKELLNLVLNTTVLNLHGYTTSEVLNLVLDTSNEALKANITGGTIAGDLTITGDLTVGGSATIVVDDVIQGNMIIGGTEDDVTGGTTDGSATLNATGAFASASVGDWVHITDSTTAEVGAYKIITVTDNDNVELDRNVTADAGDVDFTIHYNAIVFEEDTVTDVATAHFNGGVYFSKGSQDYLFTDRGDQLSLQGQKSGSATQLEMYGYDATASNDIYFSVFAKGTPSSVTDRQRLQVGYEDALASFAIKSEANTSSPLPIAIYTEGNTNQLYLATNGNVGLSVVPDALLGMPSTTAGDNTLIRFQNQLTTADAGIAVYGASSGSSIYIGSNTYLDGGGIARWNNSEESSALALNSNGIVRIMNGGTSADPSISLSVETDGMLDLYGGTISILAGANIAAKTRNDNSQKVMRFAVPHYLDVDVDLPMAVVYATSKLNENNVLIGGGNNLMNAATSTTIWAADDYQTHTGTEVARFEGGAAKALMMGLGNSALEAWGLNYTALQIGGNGSVYATTGAGSSGIIGIGQNIYDNGTNIVAQNGTGIVGDEAGRYYQNAGRHVFQVADQVTADATITFTDALTIAKDASATFGGNVTISKTGNDVAFNLNRTDANHWRMFTDSNSDFFIYDVTGTANKVKIEETANGLITLSGGAGGVRLDNTVGIGVAPDPDILGFFANSSTITVGVGNSAFGLYVDPDFQEQTSGTHNIIAGVCINDFVVTNGVGGGTNTLAGLYIADAPSGITPNTNGPYSIFVDAGRSRFDGFINHGPIRSSQISIGTISVVGSYYEIVVEGGTGNGADTLNIASGGSEGDELYLSPATSGASDQVTIADGTGSGRFILAGGTNFVMDHVDDRIHFIHNGTEWVEITRSSNS